MTLTLIRPTVRQPRPVRREPLTDLGAQVLLGELAAFARLFGPRRPRGQGPPRPTR